MSHHIKKCWPASFDAVLSGAKPFEWRKEDDVTYAVGDTLILMEFVASTDKTHSHLGFTGRECRRRVTYVLRSAFGIPGGYAILGLMPEPTTTR